MIATQRATKLGLSPLVSLLNGSDARLALSALGILEKDAKNRLASREGDNQEWFEAVTEILLAMSPGEGAESCVQILLSCMEHFYSTRQAPLAIAAGEHALTLAVENNLPSLARRACNILGVFHREVGNLGRAMEYFSRALTLARQLGDTYGECAVLANCASITDLMGRYDETISCCRRVLAISHGDPAIRNFRCQANQLIARACLFLKRTEEGIAAITNALVEADEPKTAFEFIQRVRRHHAETSLYLQSGNLEKAREALHICRQYAMRSGLEECQIQTEVSQALVESRGGQLDVAESRLQQLLTKYAGNLPVRADVLLALVDVYEQSGRKDEANRYLQRFHDLFQKRKVENVLEQLRQIEARLKTTNAPDSTADEAKRELLEHLAVVGELRDDATGEHAYRVGRLSALIAEGMGLEPDFCNNIDLAGRLHDLGKVAIPDRVLLSPGRLEGEDLRIMRTHTVIGHEILCKSHHHLMKLSADIARSHHEWWNGTGYPDGLHGGEIPLAARIVALADVFDALSHARPYKAAWTFDDTMEEILSLRTRQFDPTATDIFVRIMANLANKHGPQGIDAVLSEGARDSSLIAARHALRSDLLGPNLSAIDLASSTLTQGIESSPVRHN
jgi:putative two-component system response regulator